MFPFRPTVTATQLSLIDPNTVRVVNAHLGFRYCVRNSSSETLFAISIGFSVFCRLLPTSLFGSFVSPVSVILITRNKLRWEKDDEKEIFQQADAMDTAVPATNNLLDPGALSLCG